MNNPNNLAEEHWLYTHRIMKLMYIEAFKHGFKHGKEAKENVSNTKQ